MLSDALRASLFGLALPFVGILPPATALSVGDQQNLLMLASEPLASPEPELSTSTRRVIPTRFAQFSPTQTDYCDIVGKGTRTQTPGAFDALWFGTGTFSNLLVTLTNAPGVGKSWTATVYKNGSPTSLSVTISGTATSARTAGTLAWTSNERIHLRVIPSASTPAATGAVWVSIEWESETANESVYGGNGGASGGSNGTVTVNALFSPYPNWTVAASQTEAQKNPVAAAGSVTGLSVRHDGTHPGGAGFRLYVNKNGTRQDGSGGTVNTEVSTIGLRENASTFSLPLSPGDVVFVEAVRVGTTSVNGITTSCRFVATTSGESQFCAVGGNVSTNLVTYANPYIGTWHLTESDANLRGGVTTFGLKHLFVRQSAAPGSAKSYTYDVRRNEGAVTDGQTVTVSGTTTPAIGSDTTRSYTITEPDTFALRSTPSGNPTATTAAWSYIQVIAATEVEPEFPPPSENPPPGDPIGAIYVARIVHSGGTIVQRAETTIRDPQDLWDGKKPSGLLKVGKVRRTLAPEGYPAAEMTIELDDTPDPITGVMFWRNLSATITLEGAYVEVNRHEAPYGITIGTPWRVFAGRIAEGGHKPIDGFRYSLTIHDILSELFSDLQNQPPIPRSALTVAEFAGMLPSFDGKFAPRVLGNSVQDGEGVCPMIPMGRINVLSAFGSGVNLEVGVGLIALGAVYDVVEGYYTLLTWEGEKTIFLGEERIPTTGNPGYGYVFRATVAGTTDDQEPHADNGNAWPTTLGATVADGTVTWQNTGVYDATQRRRIPNELYGVAGGLAVPHKPGWAAVTGADPSNPVVPGEYVIYGNPPRAWTPVLWDLSHPYSPYVESGAIQLVFDVIGAMDSPTSGTPILDLGYLYVHLLLNYGWHETDGRTYGNMPLLPGLTGDYAAIDMDTVQAAKAIGDALGGLVGGFVLAAQGEAEGLWERLSKILKHSALRIGQNRHGQLVFHRKNASAAATLTLDEQRDQVKFEQWVESNRRGTRVEYQHSYRYLFAEPTGTSAGPGQPIVVNGKPQSRWASGLQIVESSTAETLHEASWGRSRPRKIALDMDSTRDANTANQVAALTLADGTGPSPSYDGIRMFRITGPYDRLLMRLGTDGKECELGTVVSVTNSEGMSGTGYVLKKGWVTGIEQDVEPDLATITGEILA